MSSQILEDSLGNTGILAELLKIKFVRRLGGFFRCDSGDKGYFAHLQWEPQNVKFIHCACKFYQVLLQLCRNLSKRAENYSAALW